MTFILTSLPAFPVYANELNLPKPGTMVHLSPAFVPAILKGIKVHPDNPFKFEFVLDKGDGYLNQDQLKVESSKLIKYFLVSLTVPEKDLWVNLSPYEKDRIIPDAFGKTEMGRDLLAQDYMLKQITASLIYPEDEIGKKFWKRIYEEAAKRFGTTNIPVNTFNKVWIVPEKAVVYENAKAGTAYVVESKLKVMLEQDYLALQKSTTGVNQRKHSVNEANSIGSQIVKEIIIPQLTKEINTGSNFTHLRQVYSSLILAIWYKKKIKDSILSQVYADKNKVSGVNIDDPQEKQKIYERYLQAFKKGAYNYIKEEIDPVTQQVIPRKYFSGGMQLSLQTDKAMIITDIIPNLSKDLVNNIVEVTTDLAMSSRLDVKAPWLIDKTRVLEILERHEWDIGSAKEELGIKPSGIYSSVYKFFEDNDLLSLLKDKVETSLNNNNWLLYKVGDELGIGNKQLTKLIDTFGLERKSLSRDALLSKLEELDWNFGSNRETLGMKNTTLFLDFFKEAGLIEELKAKVQERLEKERWGIKRVAASFGISIPPLRDLISQFKITPLAPIAKDALLAELNRSNWNFDQTIDPLMLGNESYYQFLTRYDIIAEARTHIIERLKFHGGAITTMARELGLSQGGGIDLIEALEIPTLTKPREEVLVLIKSNDWNIRTTMNEVGLGSYSINGFIDNYDFTEELRPILEQRLSDNEWNTKKVSDLFGVGQGIILRWIKRFDLKQVKEDKIVLIQTGKKRIDFSKILVDNSWNLGVLKENYQFSKDGNLADFLIRNKLVSEFSDRLNGAIQRGNGSLSSIAEAFGVPINSLAFLLADTDLIDSFPELKIQFKQYVLEILHRHNWNMRNTADEMGWTGKRSYFEFFDKFDLLPELKAKMSSELKMHGQKIYAIAQSLGIVQEAASSLINRLGLIDLETLRTEVVSYLEETDWDFEKLRIKFGIPKTYGLKKFFERVGLLEDLKIKMELELRKHKGSKLAVSKRFRTSAGTIETLSEELNINTVLSKAEILGILDKNGWKIDRSKEELGLKNRDSLYEFFVKNDLLAELRSKLSESLKLNNNTIVKVGEDLGISQGVVTKIINELNIPLINSSRAEVLSFLITNDWNLGALSDRFKINRAKGFYFFIESTGIQDEVREVLNIEIVVKKRSLYQASQRFNLAHQTLKTLLDELKIAYDPGKDFILETLENADWNIGQVKEAIGLHTSKDIYEFFKEKGLEDQLKEKLLFRLKQRRWKITPVANDFGVALPLIGKLMAIFSIETPVFTREMILESLVHNDWNLETIRQEFGLGPTEDLNKFLQTYDLGEDLKAVLFDRLEKNGWIKSRVAALFGTFSSVISRWIEFYGIVPTNSDWEEEAVSISKTIQHPGDLLDVLLALYGDKRKPSEIKSLVRKFKELNLSEVSSVGGGSSSVQSEGVSLLEFYFKKASLVNQKEKRDRDTLISVFIKIAFKDLMRTSTRASIMEQLEQRKNAGVFFAELYEQVRNLVEDGMVFQASHIKSSLWPHQSVAAHFLRTTERAHLGDFTGAGKSIEVLAALDPLWKVYIAVPAGLVDNWVKEIRKHYTHTALEKVRIVVLKGGINNKRRLLSETKDMKNVIIIGSIEGGRNRTLQEIDDLNNGLDLMIIDESQKIVNYRGIGVQTNARQAESVQMIRAQRKWFLSATGYGSEPTQLFAVLSALFQGTNREHEYSDFRTFRRLRPSDPTGLRYLRADLRLISLSRQADEVMDRYEDPNVVPFEQQHRSGARLPNLHEIPYTEMGGYTLNDEQLRILMMMVSDFRKFAQWYNARQGVEKVLDENNLTPFSKLYYIFLALLDPKRVGGTTESPYWQEMDRVVEKYLHEGKKGAIYTNNVFILESIRERYGHYGIARIDGTVQGYAKGKNGEILKGYFDEETGELVIDPLDLDAQPISLKTYQKYLFQSDPNIKLIVVNSKSGGVGLDLTAAEFYILAQLPDTFTLEKQIDGRQVRPDLTRPRYMVDKIRMIARYPPDFQRRFQGTEFEETARLLTSRSVTKKMFLHLFDNNEKSVTWLWEQLIQSGYIDSNGLISEERWNEVKDNPDLFVIPGVGKEKLYAVHKILNEAKSSGSPSEIQIDRLNKQKNVFEYVMTDLASDDQIDLFDVNSLAAAIPGFNEDPTMREFLDSLKSEHLKRVIQQFLPLYEKAKTAELKWRVLQLAQLFYQTGELKDINRLIAVIDGVDETLMEKIGAIDEIPNKFAKTVWVQRIKHLLEEELSPDTGIANLLEFLNEWEIVDADFLALPVYYASKAYENGETSAIIYNLINEISEKYRKNPHYKRMHFYEMAQSLLSVQRILGTSDIRDEFRQVMQEYGFVFEDQNIDLERRLKVFDLLLKTIALPNIKQIIFENTENGNIDSLEEAIKKGVVERGGFVFNLNKVQLRNLADHFLSLTTAVQIQANLLRDPKYRKYADEFSEIMGHIADGDFTQWRNEQVGERRVGAKVNYKQDEGIFWKEFTKDESVQLNGFELTKDELKVQLEQLAGEINKTILNETGIINAIDNQWVAGKFKEWITKADRRKELGFIMQQLATAKAAIKGNRALNERQLAVLKAEGISGSEIDLIGERLEQYSLLEDWIDLIGQLQNISRYTASKQGILEVKMNIARLTGRSLNAEVSGFIEQLEALAHLLENINDATRYDVINIDFTSSPDLMMRRGALRPDLTNCFNPHSNPRQVSTLTDDLGSRNKMLVTVKSNDQVLAVAVLKVKRLENGVPVLFIERTLSVRGYGFEREIIEAIKRTKLAHLSNFGVKLASDARGADESVKVFETGGYSDQEYFESLFTVRNRSIDNPTNHNAKIIDVDRASISAPRKDVEFDFVGGMGYEKLKIEDFIRLLKAQGVHDLVDVRENPFSYRPEFSGKLPEILKANGINYVHYRALGAPKSIRGLHELGGNDKQFMEAYEQYFLNDPNARKAYQDLKDKYKGKRICLMCYEAKTAQCHRSVILKYLDRDAQIKDKMTDLRNPNPSLFGDDFAMIGNTKGGIDLTSDKALTVQNNGQAIKFHLDPAQMAQWQNAPGVTFEIINIQPMPDIRGWLGLNDQKNAGQMASI